MKKLKKLSIVLSILSILTFFTPANAELKVVTSIKPIHSLASYLMDGVAKPGLIVDGYASPHGFAMKPSHTQSCLTLCLSVVSFFGVTSLFIRVLVVSII
jgi:zinc transport system substrate-binding protein